MSRASFRVPGSAIMPRPLELPAELQNIDWDPPPKRWRKVPAQFPPPYRPSLVSRLFGWRPRWWRGLPLVTRKRLTLLGIGGWLVFWHVWCRTGISPWFIDVYRDWVHVSNRESVITNFHAFPSGTIVQFGWQGTNVFELEIYYFSLLGFLIGLPLLWLAAYDWLRPLPQADPDRESSPTAE